MSDDGDYGFTLIAFVGSVFSPYYFKARRMRPTDPREHCAINIALYGKKRRWTMTERRRSELRLRSDEFRLGPSRLRWNSDDTLSMDLSEVGTPTPWPVRGEVHLKPQYINERGFPLDDAGRHNWRPIAPNASIEVKLTQPRLHWSGHAYFDRNWGAEPLETGFISWDWSRAAVGKDTVILYDMVRRDRSTHVIGLRFDEHGHLNHFTPPEPVALSRSPWWRMPRATSSDPGFSPSVIKTLEDTPFYVRSVVATQVEYQCLRAVHESLSLDRFRSAWVQRLLPYRMPHR